MGERISMSMDWRKDKKWSDRFLPEIKSALGLHLIGAAPEIDDQMRNTDLIVLKMEAVRIACRIRQFKWWQCCANEFTIRVSRPSGAKTELTKVIEGWGNYFFYGFASENEASLHAWLIGDLNAFRLWHSRKLLRGVVPGTLKSNGDGSSDFRYYDAREVPGFVVAASPGHPVSECPLGPLFQVG